jgi:hypothetical protein
MALTAAIGAKVWGTARKGTPRALGSARGSAYLAAAEVPEGAALTGVAAEVLAAGAGVAAAEALGCGRMWCMVRVHVALPWGSMA